MPGHRLRGNHPAASCSGIFSLPPAPSLLQAPRAPLGSTSRRPGLSPTRRCPGSGAPRRPPREGPGGPTSSCSAPGSPPAGQKGASSAAGSSATASWASAPARRCNGCERKRRGEGGCQRGERPVPARCGSGGGRYLLNILAASSRISFSHTRSVSSTCRKNSASRRLHTAGSCAGPAAAAIIASAAPGPTARPRARTPPTQPHRPPGIQT